MVEIFRLLQPLQFLEKFLENHKRIDGRSFDEFRDILISCDCVDTANGSAFIKFGNSSIMCGITTSIVKPLSNKPEEGILDINIRFSNTCQVELDHPDRSTVSDYLRECLKKIFFHSKILNLESLCLIPRKYVWKLSLEIICLNMNGSLVDLALLTTLCSLKKCKLQHYEIDPDFDFITPTDRFDPIVLKAYPIMTTIAVFKNHLLVDPLLTEEELSTGIIRICVDPDVQDLNSLYLLEITGLNEIDPTMLKDCYTKAMKRANILKSFILKHTDTKTSKNDIKFENSF